MHIVSCKIHRFPARKGLHALAPRFPDFVLNIGFTIEGRSDDELPGVLQSLVLYLLRHCLKQLLTLNLLFQRHCLLDVEY